jgi:SAM-dependent methyltransferase
VRELYEAVWERAPRDPEPWAFGRRRALLLDRLRPGERVLDLGCGAGRFCAVALEAGAQVAGVDIAEAALERARANAPGADLRRVEADGTFPFEDAAFDLVWCSEVLEHVPDTQGFLSEARRVLTAGGRLLVTTPSHSLLRRTAMALVAFERHFDPLGEHVRFYTGRSLARTLRELGFDPVRVHVLGAMLAADAGRPAHALVARSSKNSATD